MGSKSIKRFSLHILKVVLFSLLICITIGFSGVFGNSKVLLADVPLGEILTEENEVELDLGQHGEYQLCSFTPSVTGYYEFTFDEPDNYRISKGIYEHEGDIYLTATNDASLIRKLNAGTTYTLKIESGYSSGTLITISVARYTPVTSGPCGDSITWDYDLNTDTLTISGSGEMYDYVTYSGASKPIIPWNLFKTDVKTVIVGDGITYIGENSFSQLKALESATLGKDVKVLGDYAFQLDDSLKHVTLSSSSGLTTIGHYVFGACYKLESFAIPETVTSIGNGAFSSCYMLSDVTLPEHLTVLGNSAFTGCDSITEITIPSGITSIGDSMFSGCDNLSKITIPQTVTSIGEEAFYYCVSLKEITLPSGLTRIERSTFRSCRNLTSIDIPENVEYIGPSAFDSCISLGSVKIPKNVSTIEASTFSFCSKLSSISIPDTVTSIKSDAFHSCESLSEVKLPSALKEIGIGAFYSCERLSNLVFGENLTSIEDDAFAYCSSLTEVTLPNTLRTIGARAFKLCTNLTSVFIPGSVNTISSNAFYYCTLLEDLTIEEGVQIIGKEAFCYCENLETLTIPASIIRIERAAFNECSSMTNIYCFANPLTLTWTGANNDFIPWLNSGNIPQGQTKCHVPETQLDAFRSKFGYGYVSDGASVNVTFVGDLSETINMGLGEHLFGYSLSLEGDIGVNFYMDLSNADLSEDAYMEFTVPNGNQTSIRKIYVQAKDGENRTVAKEVKEGESTYYIFKCQVSAKDFASPIRAQLIDGGRSGERYSYTVKAYGEYILSHVNDDPAYAKAAPLVKSLLQYCTCAQHYFKVGTIDYNYIDGPLFYSVDGETVDKDAPAYEIDLDQLPGVTFEGATLSLKSETTLSLYFISSEKLTFSCNKSNKITTERVDEYQVVRIRGISAAELDNLFEITVSCGSKQGHVSYSALNYISSIVKGDRGYELTYVAGSLYLYYKAINEYYA
ncbi:MAG: leucine-rich repeat domain-containing protein [Clostridiales bacterium]|nr:leucine-rich repeat domain-containing protein [Clostridiales bacterium]